MKLEGDAFAEARLLDARVMRTKSDLADADIAVARAEQLLAVANNERNRHRGRLLAAVDELQALINRVADAPNGAKVSFNSETGEVKVQA